MFSKFQSGSRPNVLSFYRVKQGTMYFNRYTVHFCSVFKNNQQMQFLTVLLLHSTARTYFDSRASSSGCFSMLTELH
jgi:hypothetical protein